MTLRISNGEKGFSLIEFMVANAATMAMLAATFTLLNMVFTANAGMTEALYTQENVRVAMNTITRDAIMAGTGLPDSGIAIPNGANSAALVRPGVGGTLPTPNNVIAILTPGDGGGATIAGVATDTLTIAMIDQTSPTWNTSAINAAGTQIDFVQDPRSGATQLNPNDLLLFNNANGSAFGCVTSVSLTLFRAFFANLDALNINQPNAAAGNIASLKNAGNPVTFPPTTASRIMLVTYYLDYSNTADPKLMRAVNGQTPQVMVENIENLQFTYDLFNYNNDTETSNLATTANPNQIRSVHVAITGRSPDILKQTHDYFRFGLVSKVDVRNATFRNRYS